MLPRARRRPAEKLPDAPQTFFKKKNVRFKNRTFETVKKAVIASRCAHRRGNPLSKTFRFHPDFQENRSFESADSHGRFAPSE